MNKVHAETKTQKIEKLRDEVRRLSKELDSVGLNGGRVSPNDPKQKRINTLRKQIKQIEKASVQANTVDGSDEKQAAIRELIAIFLQLNPDPADNQVHSLAAALAVDKESLESVFYEMLGRAIGGEEPVEAVAPILSFKIEASSRMKAGIAEVSEDGGQGDAELSLDQKVREGDYNENEIPVDDLMINDGPLAMEDADTGFQEELKDDGFVGDDADLGNGATTQDVLRDDGTPDLEV